MNNENLSSDESTYVSAVNGRREFRRALRETRERAAFPKDRNDPATWVLHLLAHGEISVGKAGEWLRHYIHDGHQDPLPPIAALP